MSFNSTRDIVACRKPHRCHWCGERIEKGAPAVRVAGLADGDFGQCHWHPDCHAVTQVTDQETCELLGIDEPFDPGLFRRGSIEQR